MLPEAPNLLEGIDKEIQQTKRHLKELELRYASLALGVNEFSNFLEDPNQREKFCRGVQNVLKRDEQKIKGAFAKAVYECFSHFKNTSHELHGGVENFERFLERKMRTGAVVGGGVGVMVADTICFAMHHQPIAAYTAASIVGLMYGAVLGALEGVSRQT